MGLKAFHLLQQTGKTASKYVDTVGLGVRKWVKPTNIEGLHFAPEAIGDTVKISSKKFIPPKTSQRSFSSIASAESTINPMGSAEEVGLYEHGLHEIMVDPKAYQEIGQTVVHSPVREVFNPETMVKIEGEVLYYPKCPNTNILAKKYTITPVLDKYGISCEYKVQFFDDAGLKVDAVQRLPRTSKLTSEEVKILREKGAFNRAVEKPVTPTPTITEPNIMGFRIPKGTVSHTLKDVGDGTQALRFLDKDGNTIRKIVLSDGGSPISYSDFSSEITKQSLTFRNGHIVEEASVYDKVKTNTNYELENGKVVRSTQSKTIATHKYGKTEGRYTQKVRTSTTGNGSYLQDITIENGTKRFNIMIMQGQKGKKGCMLGNCIGLTPEEIELLKTDPFLATRYYNNNLDFIRAAHRDGMKLQGLRDTSTPLYFEAPNGPRQGGYYHRGRHTVYGYNEPPFINVTPRCVMEPSIARREWFITHTNHEPRHGVQHDMVDDLEKGLLSGRKAQEATVYRDNFSHYIGQEQWNAYMAQPVEVDARRAGEEATELFRNIGKKIDEIFGIN